jgi:D-tyrosyl-tRNA(Tyr) deacylase
VRAVVQRVSQAEVSVGGEVVGSCAGGLLVLLGVAAGDEAEAATALARKVALLRVFEDEAGRFDRSIVDVAGEALVVSQFTLLADTSKGNRPSFTRAAAAADAEPLVERFTEALRAQGVPVQSGRFGARMAVALVNDGPVTVVLES